MLLPSLLLLLLSPTNNNDNSDVILFTLYTRGSVGPVKSFRNIINENGLFVGPKIPTDAVRRSLKINLNGKIRKENNRKRNSARTAVGLGYMYFSNCVLLGMSELWCRIIRTVPSLGPTTPTIYAWKPVERCFILQTDRVNVVDTFVGVITRAPRSQNGR